MQNLKDDDVPNESPFCAYCLLIGKTIFGTRPLEFLLN